MPKEKIQVKIKDPATPGYGNYDSMWMRDGKLLSRETTIHGVSSGDIKTFKRKKCLISSMGNTKQESMHFHVLGQ